MSIKRQEEHFKDKMRQIEKQNQIQMENITEKYHYAEYQIKVERKKFTEDQDRNKKQMELERIKVQETREQLEKEYSEKQDEIERQYEIKIKNLKEKQANLEKKIEIQMQNLSEKEKQHENQNIEQQKLNEKLIKAQLENMKEDYKRMEEQFEENQFNLEKKHENMEKEMSKEKEQIRQQNEVERKNLVEHLEIEEKRMKNLKESLIEMKKRCEMQIERARGNFEDKLNHLNKLHEIEITLLNEKQKCIEKESQYLKKPNITNNITYIIKVAGSIDSLPSLSELPIPENFSNITTNAENSSSSIEYDAQAENKTKNLKTVSNREIGDSLAYKNVAALRHRNKNNEEIVTIFNKLKNLQKETKMYTNITQNQQSDVKVAPTAVQKPPKKLSSRINVGFDIKIIIAIIFTLSLLLVFILL